MTPAQLQEFESHINLYNEMQDWFEALDEYRQLLREKKKNEADRKLWKAHEHERNCRKLSNYIATTFYTQTQTKAA